MRERIPRPGITLDEPQGNRDLSGEEFAAFQRELAPIFDERSITLGHGTRIETAEQILPGGLTMKEPALQSTTIGLENSKAGISKILNWPHLDAKAVVVVMFPKDARMRLSTQEEILERLPDTPEGYGNGWKLPPKFIKGYIDVEKRKFIPNPAFESDPRVPEPVAREERRPVGGEGPVDVPAPSDNKDVDIF